MKKKNRFNRRSFMKLAAVQTASVVAGCATVNNKSQAQIKISATGERPNVVLIVSDDHRWDLMSCAGNKYMKTPNLDRLAKEGILFENAFACSSLCSPSRASILTGKYCHQAAATSIIWTNNSFRMQEKPFPARLHDVGYHTSHFGKWHLGEGDKPMNGYDHWAGFEWLGSFFDTKVTINGKIKSFKGFSDDILSNLAAEYITERAGSGQPFCTFLGLKAPHLAFDYPPRLEHAFDGIDIPKPDSYNEDYGETGRLDYLNRLIDVKKWANGGLPMFDNSWEKYVKSYYRSALAIDDAVGNVLNALDDAGIADNTIVIYTSDHGYSLGEHGLTEKHFAHEEAMRIPMIIRYPKMIKRSIRRKELALTIDIAPTLMDICTGSVPPDMVGRSWKPLL
jgi:arylsulfatase A-like enzyme